MKMIQTEPKHKVPSMTAAPLTMSSREIADLCETRHNQVVDTIQRLLASGVLRETRNTTRRVQPAGGGRPMDVYDLTKRDTLVVVSGYKDELRARIIDRWMELERPGAYEIPRTLGDALQLAADQAREIEDLRDTAAAHERLTAASGALCVTDAAKALGIGPKTLFDWLETHGWTYRRNGGDWLGYAPKCAAGLLEHRVGSYLRTDGTERIKTQVLVTAKGLSRLAQLIAPTAEVMK